MELRRCYKPACMRKAEFRCNCTKPVALMCQAHIGDHVSNSEYPHNLQPIPGVDPEAKKLALDLLYEERSKINQLKEESLNIFTQLFSSLENLLKSTTQILDMNLDDIEQKMDKIISGEEIADFQTDQLLSSLISRDAFEAEKICLIDSKTLKNIKAINTYAKEINKTIMKLNIHTSRDLARNDVEDKISQFYLGNLNNQHENQACELEKWENTVLSWNKDFKNFPKAKENWYFKLGLIHYLAGNVYAALSLFSFAIKLNPKYSDCYFYKGIVLAGLGRKEESLECWNYLLQANKKFAFLNIIKARVLYLLERDAESIEVYDQFIQNNPERCFVNILKNESLYEKKKYREIKVCSEEMIRLNPKFSWAYSDKGQAFEGLKEYSNALKWLRKAIEKDDQCYYAYQGIAAILSHQNNNEESLDYINIAISINPFSATSHNNKGKYLSCMERNEETLECYNEAIKLDPNLSYPYYNIGCIFYSKGQYEEAIRYHDMALKIKPSDEDYQYNKNAALLKLEEQRKKE